MTNKQQSKVRFVRCPKCTKILPEPEHVPLYACGGCGAILQVKNYKGPEKNTALSSHEQDVRKRNGIKHACYAGESSGSSRRSSSDHSSPQEEGKSSDGVEYSRNSEQNEAASSFDISSLSKESSFFKGKENGEIYGIKSDKICSNSEPIGGANSSEDTSLSFKNQENGEIEDSKSEGSCSKSEQNVSANYVHHMALSEESGCTGNKENGDRERKIDQFDSKDRGANDHPTLLDNEPQKLNREIFARDETIDYDDDDDDEHEEKLVRPVKSAKDAFSLTEASAIKNPSKHHASDHVLSERTRKIYIEGKHTHDDRHEQNQIGYMLSAKDVSSCTESPGIEKPTQGAFENPAENDASEKHSHPEVLRSEINLHELGEAEVAKPGKEYVNGTAPVEDASSLTECPDLTQLASKIFGKHFASDHEVSKEGKLSKENGDGTYPNVIAEQLESVHISSAPSLSTFLQGENDESVRVSTPSSVEVLKTSYEIGPTKVSEDRLLKNSFDNVKGTLKQNIENVRESDVHIDRRVGNFLKEMPEFSSKRSPTYDGSVSSFDGNDDKVAEQPPQLGEETLLSQNVRPSRQAKGSSSMVLDEKFKRMIIEEEEEEGPLERNEIPRRFRRNRENFLPRGPNYRSSELTYETGSTSSYALHDEPPRQQMHSHHLYGRGFREPPLWREKEFLPVYYNSESSGEFYDRPKHHTYNDRRRRTESWSQSGTLPRNPYSGEMFKRYPYMHRYPEDRRWSAQLPPPAMYFQQGGYMNPGWETRWDPYDSYSNSPHQFMEPEPSDGWAYDTISLSDDPRHKDQFMREMYLREKRQAMKTPLHPIAGGTPFITCYFCFHILQLPQNFLLSRRRRRKSHKLECGACSRVLEFSLENEGGFAPCETNLNTNVNFSMSSHSQVNHSRHSSVTSVDSRILLSRDSFGASNREKRTPGSRSSSKGDDDDGDGDGDDDDVPPARGRPSKVTWNLPDRSKSPLHKLMGYSSPKEMLAFHEDDDIE